MTRLIPEAAAAIARALKSRLSSSSRQAVSTGAEPPAAPVVPDSFHCPRWPGCSCPDGTVDHNCPGLKLRAAAQPENSLQTLVRLVTAHTTEGGEPVQSMCLLSGRYVRARLLTATDQLPIVHLSDGAVRIGRCMVYLKSNFHPDEWHLAVFPVNGKADVYEGFVE